MGERIPINIFWFRRDLRLEDNAGLYHALKSGNPVLPIFIFDTNILGQLGDPRDARVEFIMAALNDLQQKLVGLGSSLEIHHGRSLETWRLLLKEHSIGKVFANHDYEPYAIERDNSVKNFLARHGIEFLTYKDQVIFEKTEIVKDNGEPYTIFTPYSRKWKSLFGEFHNAYYPTGKYHHHFYRQDPHPMPSLESFGFKAVGKPFPSPQFKREIISGYDQNRDFPALCGTSRLGVHLRFGTISIRKLAREAGSLNAVFLNELIWRDFYQMILWHFPRVGKGKSFKPEYNRIEWRNNEEEFKRWQEGKTGFPLVDAGMRELAETGYMHNRVRMVVASFLAKHLLIDWRWGEAWFAERLLDFDLAANNGGWQWAAGSGCDVAPYFRIFNPRLQAEKFDPELKYIRKWVPELDGFNYPQPIVDHDMARKRCLEVYGKALGKVFKVI